MLKDISTKKADGEVNLQSKFFNHGQASFNMKHKGRRLPSLFHNYTLALCVEHSTISSCYDRRSSHKSSCLLPRRSRSKLQLKLIRPLPYIEKYESSFDIRMHPSHYGTNHYTWIHPSILLLFYHHDAPSTH